MSKTVVLARAAPLPAGPYTHAVGAIGELVYLSGQTPIDPETGQLVDGDLTVQAHRVFENLRLVLEAARLTFDDAVKVNVYLADMADFGAMNAVYQRVFRPPYPARTTVAVAGLPLGARIEIELTAVRSAPRR